MIPNSSKVLIKKIGLINVERKTQDGEIEINILYELIKKVMTLSFFNLIKSCNIWAFLRKVACVHE